MGGHTQVKLPVHDPFEDLMAILTLHGHAVWTLYYSVNTEEIQLFTKKIKSNNQDFTQHFFHRFKTPIISETTLF